jgi:hypothetical protein
MIGINEGKQCDRVCLQVFAPSSLLHPILSAKNRLDFGYLLCSLPHESGKTQQRSPKGHEKDHEHEKDMFGRNNTLSGSQKDPIDHSD